MKYLRANKQKFLLLTVCFALCLSVLLSCGNLGLTTPQEQDMARDQQHQVNNTADKHRISQAKQESSSAMIKVTTEQAGNDDKSTGNTIDCDKIMAARQKYYLKSLGSGDKVEQVRVGATGYGAPPKNYYPEGQRRLMTIRAAKVDAYRALAEVVGGLHIWGGSAIGDMVVERDRYSVFVDAYVRGARVISVAPMEDGTYKTTVEMDVDQRFLSQVKAYIDPLISHHCADQDIKKGNGSVVYNQKPGVTSTFYYSE